MTPSGYFESPAHLSFYNYLLYHLLFRKWLITAGPEEPQQSSKTSEVPFCVCGYCREMPTDNERACCKERRLCRSTTLAFQNICLDSNNLATVIRSLADTYVFTPTYDNWAMRHAAYRQYVMWIHGHLGKGNRTSCCVWKIRKHYPMVQASNIPEINRQQWC